MNISLDGYSMYLKYIEDKWILRLSNKVITSKGYQEKTLKILKITLMACKTISV